MNEGRAKHGTLKTSTIMISTGKRLSVYRKLEEVPPGLRSKLVKSTAGSNAGTVLIADRRGAEELLRSNGRGAVDEHSGKLRGLAAAFEECLRRIRIFAQTSWRSLRRPRSRRH
jgi:hypothetical protein